MSRGEFVGEVCKGQERDILRRSNETGGYEMLRPDFRAEIPEETVKVTRADFPNGNMYLSLRDTLGATIEDETFQDLYPTLGQPAESPGRLALITVMQYVENLSDQQAAEAVRSKIDWKYMFGLSLEDRDLTFRS